MNQEEVDDLRDRFEEVVTGLFERMDRSEDQRVDKNEFVEQYHNEYV